MDNLAQRIAHQQTELDALRREYEAREARLAELRSRKEGLESQLRRLDAEILAVNKGQAPPATPKTPPVRTTRKQTLPGLLVELLQGVKGPLTVKKLAEEVEHRKFPTSSKSIPRLVQVRVQELVRKGILQHAQGQPGFVLARSGKGDTAASGQPVHAMKDNTREGSTPTKAIKQAKPSRTTGQPPLRVVLTSILKKSRQPQRSGELAQQVLATGYKTTSGNFPALISVTLSNMDNLEHLPGEGYRLKKG
jgi:hypothetical protein